MAPPPAPGLSLAALLAAGASPGDEGIPAAVGAVEEGVLALSRRLVSADDVAARLKDEAEGLEERLLSSERRVGSVASLRRALDESVPAESLRRVQAELGRSRAAEADAQELLRTQTAQLVSLSARVDQLSGGEAARDSELKEAAEMLSRSRVEMKRREQSLRALSRQLLQLEQEKNVLYERTAQADSNLSLWRLERDLCLSYLTAVLEAVARSVQANRPRPADVGVVLESEAALARPHQGAGEPGEEHESAAAAAAAVESAQLIACRNVVRALAESGVRWQRKAVTAEEKVAHYRRHVAVLKRELAAACARAVECPEGLLSGASSLTPPGPTVVRVHREEAAASERFLGEAAGQSEC